MQLDTAHPSVQTLRSLSPSHFVAGGSFASWLPHPAELSMQDRSIAVATARETATAKCLASLIQQANLPTSVKIPRRETGDRSWPDGFVGSLTNKGTVVLAAMASKSKSCALGIDLELVEDADFSLVKARIAPEGLPQGVESSLGVTIALSAKEAVFKAQFPSTQQRIGYGDIRLRWKRAGEERLEACAELSCFEGLVVRCSLKLPWIVCVASC